jgi:biopolymer transport protein ExbB
MPEATPGALSIALQLAEQQIEDLMAVGGPVMWPLAAVSVLLWTLIVERYWALFRLLPLVFGDLPPPKSAADRITTLNTARLALQRHLRMIRTLAGILPMLGLLGTVTGIVETFDLIRLFGSADPRIIAHGVSQALITTLSGLVMGLFGVGLGYHLARRARFLERGVAENLSRR